MCRYAFSEYKNTYACFKCRKGFKRRLDKDLLSLNVLKALKQSRFQKLIYNKEPINVRLVSKPLVKCPDCQNEMVNLGKDLRLPKRDQKGKMVGH